VKFADPPHRYEGEGKKMPLWIASSLSLLAMTAHRDQIVTYQA